MFACPMQALFNRSLSMHNIAVREPSKVNPERMNPLPEYIYNLIFIFFLTKV